MSILSQFKQSQNTDFPNVRPSLDLRFALAKKLDPRITFTRGSTGTYFGPDGLMRTAGVNEPRFDHDPITGQSLGLLIEESRQNLFQYSDQFDNAYWSKGNLRGTLTADQTTAPDGTTTADLYQEDTTANGRYLSRAISFTSGTSYTVSIWAKQAPGSTRYLGLVLPTAGFGVNVTASFTLSGVGSYTISTSGTATSAGIQAYSNGWYRCYLTSQATVTTSVGVQLRLSNSSITGTPNYTGDGTSGFYLWGAQVEAGAFPTSYIPTTASTVTRSADNASMTGTNFSSWYNQSEGTFYSNVKSTTGVSGYIISARGTSAGDRHQLTQLGGATVISNVVVATFPKTYNSQNKQAYSYSTNNFSFVTDKDKITQKFSGAIPTNILYATIGRADFGGLNPINGTISRLTYYPIQLTNQQLINLSN